MLALLSGKGSFSPTHLAKALEALNLYEGQCPIFEHFVLTIHRRSIFLSKMETYARGLPSMELTIVWGTEVCA